MTEIYLIRHTQAEGNLFRAMQGHWDGDVTALGLQEIDALAERMRDVKIDALYASDLKRAVLTAGAIRRYHALPLRTEPELREINVGPWEARFFADIQHEQPREAELFLYIIGGVFRQGLDGSLCLNDGIPQRGERFDDLIVAVVQVGDPAAGRFCDLALQVQNDLLSGLFPEAGDACEKVRLFLHYRAADSVRSGV